MAGPQGPWSSSGASSLSLVSEESLLRSVDESTIRPRRAPVRPELHGFETAIAATATVIHAERERITIACVAKRLALLIAVGVLAAGCGRTMGSDSAPSACTGGSAGTRVSSF